MNEIELISQKQTEIWFGMILIYEFWLNVIFDLKTRTIKEGINNSIIGIEEIKNYSEK